MQEKKVKNRFNYKNSLILDFDGSNHANTEVERIDLRSFEESVRYYATDNTMKKLEYFVAEKIRGRKVFFIGSGDFHHISYLLIKNSTYKNLHVVVFDNHPDNMIFPLSIHCGSWVYWASKLPNVSKVSVIGITSEDVSGINILQNHYSVMRSGKVNYYCFRRLPKFFLKLSLGHARDIRENKNDLISFFRGEFNSNEPVYLSIDKDVLSSDVVLSNWDQGLMSENDLLESIKFFLPNIVSADICGDISLYNFSGLLKRIFYKIDGCGGMIDNIEAHIKKQNLINLEILSILKGISELPPAF